MANNASLREIINAAVSLKKIADMIQNYNPTAEELDDLFYLKPSLKESYDKIRDWIIPKQSDVDLSVVAPEPVVEEETPCVEIPQTVSLVVTSDNNDSGIIIDPNPTPLTTDAVEESTVSEHQPRHYVPPKSTRPVEDQVKTLIEFIINETDGLSRLDAVSKANKELVDTGLVDYNRMYKTLTKKINKPITDSIFEIKNDKIHVFKVIEEHNEKPKEEVKKLEPTPEPRPDDRPVTANDVLGSSFIDKQEFLKKVDGIPKSIYVNVAATTLSYKGNIKFVIECDKPKTMAAYLAIAKVSVGLVTVGELKKFDDITVCILVCSLIQKCGRRYNKVYTKLKNDYGIMLNKNFFESIIKGEFHPEILEIFCTK